MALIFEAGTTKVIGETQTWLQKHERVVLAVVLATVFLVLGNSYIGHAADVANAKEKAAQQALVLAQNNAAKLAQLSQQQQAEYLQVTQQLEDQNAKLLAAVTAKQAATQKQQAADKTLPPNQLAERWTALAGLQPTDVQPTTSGFAVTPAGGVNTVVQLEQVPALKAELTDAQTVVQNKDKELNQATATVNALQSQVGGLQTEVTAKSKECLAQVNDLKAQARRSKRNWFLRGAAVGGGVVLYLLVHFHL